MCLSFGSFSVVSRQPNGSYTVFFSYSFQMKLKWDTIIYILSCFFQLGMSGKLKIFTSFFCIERRHHGAPVGVVNFMGVEGHFRPRKPNHAISDSPNKVPLLPCESESRNHPHSRWLPVEIRFFPFVGKRQ